MATDLIRQWWTIAVRGIVAVVLGLVIIIQPDLTILVLATFFGVYALFDGILALAGSVWARADWMRGWPLAVEGVIDIAAGLLLLARPLTEAVSMLLIIAAWAVSTGLLEIAAAVRLRRAIVGEWFLGASGALSISLGMLLVVFALVRQQSSGIAVGAYGLVFGAALIALAIRLKGVQHNVAA